MKTTLALLTLGTGILFLSSCTKYPPASDRLTEDLAVITQYDTKVDFNNYKTYSMPSAIIKIDDKDTSQISNQLATAVLDQIKQNMDSRGFEQVAPPAVADLGIEVIYFENTYIYTYYYDWWGYYPYWYYYYPYYPVYYSTYTAGLADIELIDFKYPNTNNQTLSLRWNAYIRGLLTGSHTTAELTGAVNQAFIQTPQLKTSAK